MGHDRKQGCMGQGYEKVLGLMCSRIEDEGLLNQDGGYADV